MPVNHRGMISMKIKLAAVEILLVALSANWQRNDFAEGTLYTSNGGGLRNKWQFHFQKTQSNFNPQKDAYDQFKELFFLEGAAYNLNPTQTKELRTRTQGPKVKQAYAISRGPKPYEVTNDQNTVAATTSGPNSTIAKAAKQQQQKPNSSHQFSTNVLQMIMELDFRRLANVEQQMARAASKSRESSAG